MGVVALARAEREDLLDLLVTLTPEQWAAPSLCAGWSVRDVVAHVLSYEELGPRQLAGRFPRGALPVDRVNAVGLREYGTRSPQQLVDPSWACCGCATSGWGRPTSTGRSAVGPRSGAPPRRY